MLYHLYKNRWRLRGDLGGTRVNIFSHPSSVIFLNKILFDSPTSIYVGKESYISDINGPGGYIKIGNKCRIENSIVGENVIIRNNVTIGKACRIYSLSRIENNVTIRESVCIYPGIHVGTNTVIHKNSLIKSYSVARNSAVLYLEENSNAFTVFKERDKGDVVIYYKNSGVTYKDLETVYFKIGYKSEALERTVKWLQSINGVKTDINF